MGICMYALLEFRKKVRRAGKDAAADDDPFGIIGVDQIDDDTCLLYTSYRQDRTALNYPSRSRTNGQDDSAVVAIDDFRSGKIGRERGAQQPAIAPKSVQCM